MPVDSVTLRTYLAYKVRSPDKFNIGRHRPTDYIWRRFSRLVTFLDEYGEERDLEHLWAWSLAEFGRPSSAVELFGIGAILEDDILCCEALKHNRNLTLSHLPWKVRDLLPKRQRRALAAALDDVRCDRRRSLAKSFRWFMDAEGYGCLWWWR